MSTKLHPGAYDCYAKLADDEPYFVLRAKDPVAPALIRLWADLRSTQYGYYEKLGEARQCAADMEKWKLAHPEAKPSIPVWMIEIGVEGHRFHLHRRNADCVTNHCQPARPEEIPHGV